MKAAVLIQNIGHSGETLRLERAPISSRIPRKGFTISSKPDRDGALYSEIVIRLLKAIYRVKLSHRGEDCSGGGISYLRNPGTAHAFSLCHFPAGTRWNVSLVPGFRTVFKFARDTVATGVYGNDIPVQGVS